MDLPKVQDFITDSADDIGLYLDRCVIHHDETPKYIRVVSYVDGQEMSFKIVDDASGDIDMSKLNTLIEENLRKMKHQKDKHKTRKY